MKYDHEYCLPSSRVLEQLAFKALTEVEKLNLKGNVTEVNTNLKTAEIKVQIAQAYIDLARNFREEMMWKV